MMNDLKKLMLRHVDRAKERAFRNVERDPINEIVAIRIEEEFTSALIFTLVDILDSTGVVSKETIAEAMQVNLDKSEEAKAMLELARVAMYSMPQSERTKLYDKIMNEAYEGTPDERTGL